MTVAGSKFFWNAGDKLYTAYQDDGTLWVSDYENRRAIRIDPAQSESDGNLHGERQHIPASYASAVCHDDSTRVFSNFLEFEVKYDATGKIPFNQSWSLVRNWAAGCAPRFIYDGTDGFAGFKSVRKTPDGRAVSLLQSTLDSIVQKVKPGCHGARCPMINVTKTITRTEVVELDENNGIVSLLVLESSMGGTASIEAGGVIRYSVTSDATHMQSIFEMPYVGSNWSYPGLLVASFAATNLTLAARVSGSSPTYPKTEAGDLVIFDANDGHRPSSIKPPFGNHGMHLGVVGLGPNAAFKWQASPWGTWQLDSAPQLLDGINGTRWFINPVTMDGRFGANDTIQYGGSNVHVAGANIVFGFPGEFFHSGEASQWLHFHDSGLFLGQFGVRIFYFVMSIT